MKATRATHAIVGDRGSFEAAELDSDEAAGGVTPPLACDVGEFTAERALAEFSTDALGVRRGGAARHAMLMLMFC